MCGGCIGGGRDEKAMGEMKGKAENKEHNTGYNPNDPAFPYECSKCGKRFTWPPLPQDEECSEILVKYGRAVRQG